MKNCSSCGLAFVAILSGVARGLLPSGSPTLQEHVLSQISMAEAQNYADYDDSNWMAIVDLVHASENQLLYSKQLQDTFERSANSFFDKLQEKADSGGNADEVRHMIKGFIEKVNKVYNDYNEENNPADSEQEPAVGEQEQDEEEA